MAEKGRRSSNEDNMLRCKPSQIRLTAADVNEVDDRISNRRRAFSDVTKGKARLSTGPRQPTIVAAVHTEDGITAQHALTSTLHSPTRPSEQTTKRPRYAIPTREASALVLRPHPQHPSQSIPTPDAEPVKVDSPRTSPSPPSKLSLPKLDVAWDTALRHRRRQTSPSHPAAVGYDGPNDDQGIHSHRLQTTTAGSALVHAGREVFRELPGGVITTSPPRNTPRPPSARRTRHPKAGSREESDRLHHTQDVPEIQIMRDLDPGAPVFTPRVRFGSTTIVSEPDSAGAEVTDSSTLRIRTPSEQNASPVNERHPSAGTPLQETRPRRLRSNAIVGRPRRSSENSALALPNLERYPLLLPSNRSAFERERRESSISAVTASQDVPSSSPPDDPTVESSSTPETLSSRMPSIVSAASGISGLSISDDAAAEFLRFRSSPLDALTGELSRLSAALGPATKPTEKRISLLNGNPFDGSAAMTCEDHSSQDSQYDQSTTNKDVVSPRLLASPSHFTLPTSPIIPSTPMAPTTAPPARVGSSQRGSTVRLVDSPDDANTLAAFTATSTTPKVPVYNDATPARLQPQTPAEFTRLSRRTRNHSDSSVHREAFCVGQVLVAPRPAIPERRAYRNTYPTNAPYGSVPVLTGASGQRDAGGSGGMENEMKGQLAGLESERAVWTRRRQGGSLDVTPPGHGRFERFLH